MDKAMRYGGFWIRTLASVIDSFIMLVIMSPLIIHYYGWRYFFNAPASSSIIATTLNWGLPIVVVLIFWHYKSATLGKMACKLKIVDAETFLKPTTKQFVIRYLGYFVSTIPLGLGFLWVAFDRRKQGWHDKMAHTVVIRKLSNV